jgi:AmmeMemoRadiSam system protein A
MEFTVKQRHTLLNIAEWSIQDYLITGKRHALPDRFEIDSLLESKLGAFVSIYVKKKLRGCIGTFSESQPLYENIHMMSIQAATEDKRFKPVTREEISDMTVEISVLSSRKKINGPEEIIIGKHGVYLIHGIRRATLLPQVAAKNRWTPIEFLECCAENKLGLTKDSWKEAEIFVYEAVIIQ